MNRLTNKLEEMFLALPPSRGVTPETIAIYAKHLQDLPVQAASGAIDRLIATSRFTPTIAEIREATVQGAFGAPLADEAWAEVIREVRRVGYNQPPIYGEPRVRQFSTPLIEAAVQSVGWEAICLSDKTEVVRAQFRKAFEALAARQQFAKQTGALPLDDGAEIVALPDRRRGEGVA